jgi:hypothetical protein
MYFFYYPEKHPYEMMKKCMLYFNLAKNITY